MVLAVNHVLFHEAGKLALITAVIGAVTSASLLVDPRSVEGPANRGRLQGARMVAVACWIVFLASLAAMGLAELGVGS